MPLINKPSSSSSEEREREKRRENNGQRTVEFSFQLVAFSMKPDMLTAIIVVNNIPRGEGLIPTSYNPKVSKKEHPPLADWN